ncbi:MAG: enolase C-terminal domain-like protein, partial [Planctomycetota bacterium]
IDYIRMTVTHSGGLTAMRKIAALGEIYHVRTGCHGPTDISPAGMAACLHFDMWAPNFGIQEYMIQADETLEIFDAEFKFDDGYVVLPDRPGLGVDYDETRAEKHPYVRAYLPVNRREDGSMWHW